MAATDIALEKGLPTNIDAERFVLGSILLDDSNFIQVAGLLEAEDFSLEKHRRIFRRMGDLHERGERIDRITVANELMKHEQLESVDGLSYLVSLDDGLPQIPNARQLHPDRQGQGRSCAASSSPRSSMINRCTDRRGRARRNSGRRRRDAAQARRSPRQSGAAESRRRSCENYEGGINAFLDPSKRIKGHQHRLHQAR